MPTRTTHASKHPTIKTGSPIRAYDENSARVQLDSILNIVSMVSQPFDGHETVFMGPGGFLSVRAKHRGC